MADVGAGGFVAALGELEDEILGADPWVYGLSDSNRKNLETLMQYSQEQGLLGRKMALDELFINTAEHS